jgi:anion-transporting  ArsA/GET3 family ATPase
MNIVEILARVNSIEDLQNEEIETQIYIVNITISRLIDEIQELGKRVDIQDKNITKLTNLIGDS